MANLIITYWRDIPSQVAVKLGRKEEKRMLDNRFMEAIDMAAVKECAQQHPDEPQVVHRRCVLLAPQLPQRPQAPPRFLVGRRFVEGPGPSE